MASLNKVLLMGNLTRNPDLRYIPNGSAVCEMGLAVSRKNIVNGKEQDEVCFVDITVWGKQAESCNQYLTKGSSIFVEGRLQFDQWEDKNGGGRRSRLRVNAERVQFINTRRNEGGNNYNDNGGNNYSDNSNYSNNYNNNSGNSRDYNANNNVFDNGNYNSYNGNANANGYNNNNNYGNSNKSFAPSNPPSMPEAAFNPNDDVEDDIPF